ncbi:MAG: hypothetical protein ACE5HS_21900 [bacterium]
MKQLNKSLVLMLFVIAAALMWTSVTNGTSLQKMNLKELIRNSGRIVVATCIAIDEGAVTMPDGGKIPFTQYTFSVSKSIKGDLGSRLEVRQFGVRPSANGARVNLGVIGMPSYELNEECILILTQESKIGLTAPVGLSQGFFRVSTNLKTGRKEAVNGFNNAGLFSNMQKLKGTVLQNLSRAEINLLSQKQGPVEFDTFVSLLEKFAQ